MSTKKLKPMGGSFLETPIRRTTPFEVKAGSLLIFDADNLTVPGKQRISVLMLFKPDVIRDIPNTPSSLLAVGIIKTRRDWLISPLIDILKTGILPSTDTRRILSALFPVNDIASFTNSIGGKYILLTDDSESDKRLQIQTPLKVDGFRGLTRANEPISLYLKDTGEIGTVRKVTDY